MTAAVPKEEDLGAQQVSGDRQKKTGVRAKAAAYKQLHDDLAAISTAGHSLVLLGTSGLDGKFHLPRNHGAQDLLNAARAFKQDAAAYAAQFVSLGLDAGFLTTLDGHIGAFEKANTAKGEGQNTQGAATGGLADASHKAAIALHVLDTVVRNKYKHDPAKLAEWVIASHVEKHTPVPRKKQGGTPPAP